MILDDVVPQASSPDPDNPGRGVYPARFFRGLVLIIARLGPARVVACRWLPANDSPATATCPIPATSRRSFRQSYFEHDPGAFFENVFWNGHCRETPCFSHPDPMM